MDNNLSYESFTKQGWVKDLINQLTQNAIYYAIDNSVFRIANNTNIFYKNEHIKQSFDMSLEQLGFNKPSILGENKIDKCVREMLIHKNLYLSLNKGIYNISDSTSDINVSSKRNYIEALYEAYLIEKDISKELISFAFKIGKNKIVENRKFKSGFELVNINNKSIIRDIRETISEVVKKVTIYNLKKDKNVFIKIFKTPSITIILNDKNTLIDEYNDYSKNNINRIRIHIIDKIVKGEEEKVKSETKSN